jgi:Right handed beta helix region
VSVNPRRRRVVGTASLAIWLAVACCLSGVGPASASDARYNLWVDPANSSCTNALARRQVSHTTPWCTLQRATEAARAGDTVNVMPGRFEGTVRPAASGTASAPIRFLATSGRVVIDAAGAAVGVKIVGVNWISLEGFIVTGAADQGVYVDRANGVTLTRLDVGGNGTYGIQARASALRVSGSSISGNGMAGISELPGSIGNVYESNTISGNGRDGRPFNGDGIQLNGTGATIRNSTIRNNGDPGRFEHGIYAGRSSSAYLIESNTLEGNAASDIKAAGSGGTVRYNRLADSRIGLVFSDNAEPVSAYYNLVAGRFQHAVFFTSGTTGARAELWANTIVQTGRLDPTDDTSAVFINAAGLADIRNNLICPRRDGRGMALYLKDASRTTLVSNTNWVCGGDSLRRSFAFNGVRTTLAGWRTVTGQDGASLSTTAVTFDAGFHVASRNFGARRGQPLGLARDYAGSEVSARTPDIGAFQSSR